MNLGDVDFFKAVPTAEVEKIAALGTYIQVAEGTELIKEGSLSENLYFLIWGKVAVYKKEKSTIDHLICEVDRPTILGEMVMLGAAKHTATIRTVTKCQLFQIHRATILQFLTENPAVGSIVNKNLAELQSKRVTFINETVIDLLRKKLADEELRIQTGRFIFYLIISLCLLILSLSTLQKFTDYLGRALIAPLSIFVVFAFFTLFSIVKSQQPLSFYGLTWKNSRRAIYESLAVTITLLVIITFIKWMVLNFIPSRLLLNGLLIQGFLGHNAPASMKIILVNLVVYCLIAPFQELIARGWIQGSLQCFLTGPYRTLLSIVGANAVYSVVHAYHSTEAALLVFFPGLLWGWLYSRQKTLVGVSISHILLGVWTFYILGFS